MTKKQPPTLAEQIGKEIKRARESADLSQTELAAKMEFGLCFLHKLEHGKACANVHHLLAIDKACGCYFRTKGDRIIVGVDE